MLLVLVRAVGRGGTIQKLVLSALGDTRERAQSAQTVENRNEEWLALHGDSCFPSSSLPFLHPSAQETEHCYCGETQNLQHLMVGCQISRCNISYNNR